MNINSINNLKDMLNSSNSDDYELGLEILSNIYENKLFNLSELISFQEDMWWLVNNRGRRNSVNEAINKSMLKLLK